MCAPHCTWVRGIAWLCPHHSSPFLVERARENTVKCERPKSAPVADACIRPPRRCDREFWGELRNSTLLHHFGKVFNGDIPSHPCNPLTMWGDRCDMMLTQMRAMVHEGADGYKPCHFMGEGAARLPFMTDRCAWNTLWLRRDGADRCRQLWASRQIMARSRASTWVRAPGLWLIQVTESTGFPYLTERR